jgi:transmembrane sensor
MDRGASAGRQVIADEAAKWHDLRMSCTDCVDIEAAFAAWLATSPIHAEEYRRVLRVAPKLKTSLPEDSAVITGTMMTEPDQRLPTGHPRAAWRFALPMRHVVSAALVCCTLIAAGGWWILRRSETSAATSFLTTQPHELRSWSLVDGSSLELDIDSAARLQFTPAERRIELVRGRLSVRVAHGDARPLRVVVGNVAVRATGTRFDVLRDGAAVVVTLAEGRVRLEPMGPKDAGGPPLQELSTGYQVRIAGDNVSQPHKIDLRRAEAWHSGQVIAERMPLVDAVQEFQRFSSVPIQLDNTSLAGLPISGTFDARDLDTFLSFLQLTEGIRVVRATRGIVIQARSTREAR